ncbi:hypothetical protein AAFF_G00174540 [Aldrovandia affinis]|uniref:Uncharacterized protein n=1 Tax=Aldrovandia affinis TaxID=143900 RepID=A0AAD7R0D0_9TELE|nr:hypothetical protein AAFF_G00174540 [Aldrovandia affinis]
MFSSLHLSGLSCRFRVTCMEATSTKAPADAGGREGNELEHRFSCLRPVFPDLVTPCWPTAPYPGKRSLCLGGRKADSRCLRPLPRVSAATAVAGSVGLPLKMALINARSIGNKSFILN